MNDVTLKYSLYYWEVIDLGGPKRHHLCEVQPKLGSQILIKELKYILYTQARISIIIMIKKPHLPTWRGGIHGKYRHGYEAFEA